MYNVRTLSANIYFVITKSSLFSLLSGINNFIFVENVHAWYILYLFPFLPSSCLISRTINNIDIVNDLLIVFLVGALVVVIVW